MGDSSPPRREGKSPDEENPPGGRRRPLNPTTTPSPGAGTSRSPEGICFSIPSLISDEEEEVLWSPPRSSAKGKEPLVVEDKHASPRVVPPRGFMADARRVAPPPARPLRASRATRPPGSSSRPADTRLPLVDEDGFQLVVPRRRHRRDLGASRRVAPPRRPVPADLVGRCFNCLAFDHVAARCPNPSRCLRCEEVGHSARNCKRARRDAPPARGRGQPVRRPNRAPDATAARTCLRAWHSAASASTASSASGSTGRTYSGPPSICAGSPARDFWHPETSSVVPDPDLLVEQESSDPLPVGHPSRRPAVRSCVLPRDDHLQAREDHLSNHALVALVVGTRPRCPIRRARRYIVGNFGISNDSFSIHHYQPEDFLLIFNDVAALNLVLQGNPTPREDLALQFKRWHRLATAEADSMKFRVLVELRGIPSHAWSAAAAWEVLGDFCACPELTPFTVACSDLRHFHAVTWCLDPDLIPNVAFLRIPEKKDPNEGAELFLQPHEIIHHDLPLLRYRVEIEILEIQDWQDYSDDSDDPYWPDPIGSNSDDDDCPGFRDRFDSPPWPRQSVFRRLGDRSSSPSSGAEAVDGSRGPSDATVLPGFSSSPTPTVTVLGFVLVPSFSAGLAWEVGPHCCHSALVAQGAHGFLVCLTRVRLHPLLHTSWVRGSMMLLSWCANPWHWPRCLTQCHSRLHFPGDR
ncbi:hypothetical protein PVAP13_2NG150358 [Panicum virgatum]|uniref:CCHC-type domain-containing protein n=1 Tax=Panicum virgatum TaxID=38727 RepID=A0A8T0V9X0_PANVG|nr:hypothetical protein PVAP13_2NG150358 [Panicum virgatum]